MKENSQGSLTNKRELLRCIASLRTLHGLSLCSESVVFIRSTSLKLLFSFLLFFLFLLFGNRNQTQYLVLSRQGLCHWIIALALCSSFCSNLFFLPDSGWSGSIWAYILFLLFSADHSLCYSRTSSLSLVWKTRLSGNILKLRWKEDRGQKRQWTCAVIHADPEFVVWDPSGCFLLSKHACWGRSASKSTSRNTLRDLVLSLKLTSNHPR